MLLYFILLMVSSHSLLNARNKSFCVSRIIFLIAKKNELEAQLSEIEKSLDDIDYRAANAKA